MPISDIIQSSKTRNKQKEQTLKYKTGVGFHQEIFNQYYALNPYPLPFKTRVKKYEEKPYYSVPDIAEEKNKDTRLSSDSIEVSKICSNFKNMPKMFGYGHFFNSSTYAYVPDPYIQQIDHSKPSKMQSETAEIKISTEKALKSKTEQVDPKTNFESKFNEKRSLELKTPSHSIKVGSQPVLKSEGEKFENRKFKTSQDILSDQVRIKRKYTKENSDNKKNNASYPPNPYILQKDHHKSSDMKYEIAETEISTEKAPKSQTNEGDTQTSLESEVNEKRTLNWKIPSYSNKVGFQTDLKSEEEMIRKHKFKTIEDILSDQVRKKRKYTKKNSANKENNASLYDSPSTKRKYRRKHEHKMDTKEKIKRKYTKKNSGNTENNALLDNTVSTKRKYRKKHKNKMNTKENIKQKYTFKNRQKRENPNNIDDSNIHHKQNNEIVQYSVKHTEKARQDNTIDKLVPKITISVQKLAIQKLTQFVDNKIFAQTVKKEADNPNNKINEELNPAEYTNIFSQYHCTPTQKLTTLSITEPFKINQEKSVDTQIYTQTVSKETVNSNTQEKAKQKPVSLMDTFPQDHLTPTQEISTSRKIEQSITDQKKSTFNQIHTQTDDKEKDNSSGINAELKPVTVINTNPQQPFKLTQELVTAMITAQFKSDQEQSAGNQIYTQTTKRETDNSNSIVNDKVEPIILKDTFRPTQEQAIQILTEQSKTNHDTSLVNQLSTQSNEKEANGFNKDVNTETNFRIFTNIFLQPEFRPSQEHVNQIPTEKSKTNKEKSSYIQTSKNQANDSNNINVERKTARFMDAFPHFYFRPTQEIAPQITEQFKSNQETFVVGKKSTQTPVEGTNNFNTNVNEELTPTSFIDTFSPYNLRPEQRQRKTEEFKTNPEKSILSKISTQTGIKQTDDCNSSVNEEVKSVRFMNTFVEYHLKPTSEQIDTQLIAEQCKSNQEKTFVSQTVEKENYNLNGYVQEETGAISAIEKTTQQVNDHLLDKQISSIGQTENDKSIIMFKNSFFPQQLSYQKEPEKENYNSTMVYNTRVKDGMLHNKMNYECDPRYSIEQVPKNTQGTSVTKQNHNKFDKLIAPSTEALKFSAFCDDSYNNKLQQSLTTPTTSLKKSPFPSITSNQMDSSVKFVKVTENSIDPKKHEPIITKTILPTIQSTAMKKQSTLNSESFSNNLIPSINPNPPMLIPVNSKNHSHWKRAEPKEHYLTEMEKKIIFDHAIRYPIPPINPYPPMLMPDIYHHAHINYMPQVPMHHPIGCFCPQCCAYYDTRVQPYPVPYPLPLPPPILSNEGYTNFNEPASLNAKEAFYCQVPDNDAASQLCENVPKKRRTSRTIFTKYQLNELEKLYFKCRTPSIFDRHQLANHLGLSKTIIKSWFSNKRNKEKILSQTKENLV